VTDRVTSRLLASLLGLNATLLAVGTVGVVTSLITLKVAVARVEVRQTAIIESLNGLKTRIERLETNR